MGRKTSYFCDACGVDFGSKPHINIKQGRLYVSFMPENVKQSTGKQWDQQEVKLCGSSSELHFCKPDCLAIYFNNKVRPVLDKFKEELNA